MLPVPHPNDAPKALTFPRMYPLPQSGMQLVWDGVNFRVLRYDPKNNTGVVQIESSFDLGYTVGEVALFSLEETSL